MVTAVVVMYAELMKWAEEHVERHCAGRMGAGSTAVAEMADSAIDSVRRFSAEWEQSSDRLAAAAMAGQPYDGGTLTLKLDIDGAAKERFDAAIDVLRAQLAAGESTL